MNAITYKPPTPKQVLYVSPIPNDNLLAAFRNPVGSHIMPLLWGGLYYLPVLTTCIDNMIASSIRLLPMNPRIPTCSLACRQHKMQLHQQCCQIRIDPGLAVLGCHVIVYYTEYGYDGWSMAGRSSYRLDYGSVPCTDRFDDGGNRLVDLASICHPIPTEPDELSTEYTPSGMP